VRALATTYVIPARTHGRYLVEEGPPERLLVGFHGYGENADESLAQMLMIPGADQWTVVAVQALHRFYRGRGSGIIAASWMTSQDRERAIRDNIAYVPASSRSFPPRRSSSSSASRRAWPWPTAPRRPIRMPAASSRWLAS
jgi:hypothetical protein